MRTIKVTIFNLVVIFCSLTVMAQNSKTYKESFDVVKGAELMVNLSNADVNIETWNRNKIDVEAVLTYDGDEEDEASRLFEECPIKILGNSNRVEVTSCNSNMQNFEFTLGPNRRSLSGITPPMPPKPPKPAKIRIGQMPEMPDLPEIDFDHEKYEEEGEAYLKKFRKKMKDSFDWKGFERKIKVFSDLVNEEMLDSIKEISFDDDEEVRKIKIFTKKLSNKIEPIVINSMKDNLNFSGSLLRKGSDKISRKVTIKIPKNAQVELNLNRGKAIVNDVSKLNAKVKYSDFKTDKLQKGKHNIVANFSTVDIGEIDALNLKINHSNNVNISRGNSLNIKANASNLSIGELKKDAVINGNLGKLNIQNMDKDFELLDIDLKNADAVINLPKVDIQFYGNMRSCKVEFNNRLKFKKKISFDKTIYQNKSNSSDRMVNINAAFSNISLN